MKITLCIALLFMGILAYSQALPQYGLENKEDERDLEAREEAPVEEKRNQVLEEEHMKRWNWPSGKHIAGWTASGLDTLHTFLKKDMQNEEPAMSSDVRQLGLDMNGQLMDDQKRFIPFVPPGVLRMGVKAASAWLKKYANSRRALEPQYGLENKEEERDLEAREPQYELENKEEERDLEAREPQYELENKEEERDLEAREVEIEDLSKWDSLDRCIANYLHSKHSKEAPGEDTQNDNQKRFISWALKKVAKKFCKKLGYLRRGPEEEAFDLE